jgi:Flp pilus assembly protein TadG
MAPKHRAREEDEERDGFVLVWFALLIIVLLGIAAVAIDLVHAYQEEQHAQNAADAAALGGAVELPTDTTGTNAHNTAVNIAQLNYGFTNSGDSVSASPDLSIPNQLDVQVTRHFNTFFGSILGFGNLTVTKKAEAQFDPPAAMGSAVNHLGDVPICPSGLVAAACTNDVPPSGPIQKLWASIQGPDSDKQSGNAFSTAKCSSPPNPNPVPGDPNPPNLIVDGCQVGTNGSNDEASIASGETFQLKVPTSGSYDVWIYDPSMVNTQPNCGVPVTGIPAYFHAHDWQLNANAAYQTVGNNYYDTSGPAPGAGLDYCPGDTASLAMTRSGVAGSPTTSQCQSTAAPVTCPTAMETDYSFLDPADATGARAADPACPGTSQFPGFWNWWQEPAAVRSVVAPTATDTSDTADKDLGEPTRPASAGGPGPIDVAGPNMALDYETKTGNKSYFHQFYKLCTFNAAKATADGNEYEVKVTSPSGVGTNQFAILLTPSSGVPSLGDAVFARESLPLVAVNFTSGAGTVTSNFYVARVLPSSRTRTLQLSFFDLGDSSTGGKTGSLNVFASGTSGVPALTCQSTPAPNDTDTPRQSPATLSGSQYWQDNISFSQGGCTINYNAGSNDPLVPGYTGTTWNGRWISVNITIPAATSVGGYKCDPTVLSNCWIQLGYTPAAGSTLSDATTWDARLVGAPVRLVG